MGFLSGLQDAPRLGLHHFAHLRAVAEGLAVVESAQRYLAHEAGNRVLVAHRRLAEQVAALARRHGDPRWRLLRIKIRPVEVGGREAPPLDVWAAAEGLEDLRKSELQELYVERFGSAGRAGRDAAGRTAGPHLAGGTRYSSVVGPLGA